MLRLVAIMSPHSTRKQHSESMVFIAARDRECLSCWAREWAAMEGPVPLGLMRRQSRAGNEVGVGGSEVVVGSVSM